jgi:hypothetical protein
MTPENDRSLKRTNKKWTKGEAQMERVFKYYIDKLPCKIVVFRGPTQERPEKQGFRCPLTNDLCVGHRDILDLAWLNTKIMTRCPARQQLSKKEAEKEEWNRQYDKRQRDISIKYGMDYRPPWSELKIILFSIVVMFFLALCCLLLGHPK